MIEEPFAQGTSFIHNMEPRIKILAAFALSLAASLCSHFSIIRVYLLISVILVTAARLNFGALAKRLKPLFLFLSMIWFILPLTFEGRVLYHYGRIRITEPGILLSAMITFKSITIVLVFTALVATMTVASLGNGLHRLHLPDKLVFLLLMCYRYIAVIEEEYNRLLRAAKFRGFIPRTDLHSYKTFACLAGMLFVRASLRAQRVHKAMLCRGFNGKFHTLDVFLPNRFNSIFLRAIVCMSLGLFIYEQIWF
ncbi:MAG: cobalt ECF transporter T component CbiQ [Desulfobacterales bacterium RIFOXYA12_FULL_46_15]|nr:MAG: cobalt ECF transporter T component CbiQ [Desulfobacterales bacterium RIFOXYA12_FULL_46_15]